MAEWPYNTPAWQRLRRAKLDRDPLCHACRLRGRPVMADTVDHVVAIADGGHPFPDFDGLMSLCERCHNDKTNAVDRQDRHGSGRRFKGCDVNGNPIDPADAWHRGRLKDGKSGGSGPVAGSKTYIICANGSQKGGASWD